jgi:hypothetical protein
MENNHPETQNFENTAGNLEAEQTTSPITGTSIASSVPLVAKRTGSKKLAFVLGGIIVLALGGVSAYAVLSKSGIVKTNQPVASSTTPKSTTTTSTTATPAASADQAITNDLKSADTNLDQSSADQKNSDSALDDSSAQVTVPTE